MLGATYYRRARQKELKITNGFEEKPGYDSDYVNLYKDYHHDYRKAVQCFREALRAYDQRQIQELDTPNYYTNAQNQDTNLTRQRLTASHQLGDALRGLGHYLEAETHYRDMHVVYHRNLRNLNDIVKTLCLSGNWQHAEEFLWRVVFIHDTAWWDADTCFHMAWTLLGGIADETDSLLDHQLRNMYGYQITDSDLQQGSDLQLAEALKYLDYAIHQRPRYITFWHQTNWFTPFQNVIEELTTDKTVLEVVEEPIANYPNNTNKEDERLGFAIRVKQAQLWIALRIHSYEFPSNLIN